MSSRNKATLMKQQANPTSSKMMESPGSVPEFIQKLFRMLENQAFKDTFCWGRDGTTFIVKDTNEFSKTILPKHFKHCNFASFVRQLNKYDFHKVRNGDDGHKLHGDQAWEFVHPKFIRDRKDLLEDIKRKSPSNKVKKEETAAASQASISSAKQTEPITSTLSLDSLQEIRNIGLNLQSQIDQLKKSRSVMETNISQLKHKDTRIMAELIEFNETMTAKDNLIKDFLKLITEKEQQSPQQSQQAQRLLESYSRISQNNMEQMSYLKEHLGPVEPVAMKQEQPIHKSVSNLQNQLPNLPVVDGDPETASAAAAAASMNAGSLIGSPLKTADGLTFVTLGRLSSNMAVRDNKPAIEIMAADQTPTLATTLQRPSKRKSPSPASSAHPQSQVSWTVPPRILLVDDDSVYRDLSRKLLSIIGCTIDVAKDGVEALKKMGMEKYDLILMDIVMPKMDGISATRSIRQYDALTPIISMTSNFTDNDIMQYIGSGMTDILPKPFSKRTLYQMLEKYCAHLKAIQRVQGLDSNLIPQQPQQALGLVPTNENTSSAQEPPSSSTHSPPVLSQPPPPPPPHLYPSMHSSSTTSTSSNTSNSTPNAFPLAPYPYPVTMNSVPTDISNGDFNHVTNSDIPNVTFWPQQQPQQQDPPPAIIPNDGKFTWAVPTISQELPHQQPLFDPVAVAINESNKRHRMDPSPASASVSRKEQ